MIIHDVQQGSQRWLELRSGIATASEMDRIITPSGAPSKSATAYCNELICEVMLGRPMGTVITGIMDRGKQLEADACAWYDFQYDIETVPIGFVTRDDGRVGASPDRFIGDNALLEVKAPLMENHSKYFSAHIDGLLGSGDPLAGAAAAYKCQIQTQLYICEREWCHILSYYPGLPSAVTKVDRDEVFISKLKWELERFLEMFDTRVERLKSLGYLNGVADKPAASPGPRVAPEGKKPAPKSKPEPDLGAFGFTETDLEAYIAQLKKDKVLKEQGAQ